MDNPILTIDFNRKCKRCKKDGAADGGYCLTCIRRAILEGKYDHVIKPKGPTP